MRLLDPALSDRTIRGVGPSAEEWSAWAGWARCPARLLYELVPPDARLVVVAPHPDDETLAAGGLICDAVAAGREVAVVAVTDGQGSHPGSTLWPEETLRIQRHSERQASLQTLGMANPTVHELGVADGAVPAAVDRVAQQLAGYLAPTDVVVAPWRWDGHPDHEATTEATLRAAAQVGTVVWQAPIWGWHWVDPRSELFPVDGTVSYPLGATTHRTKQLAVRCFDSQLTPDPSTGAGPVLFPAAVARWTRDRELYFS